MKKFIITSIVLAIVFFSCKKKNEYILPKNQFIDIIVDIHIADAFYSSNQYGELKLIELDSTIYYKPVFEKHQIEKARFDSTLKFYSIQPETMDGIYEQVIERLNKMQAELEKQEEKNVNAEAQKE